MFIEKKLNCERYFFGEVCCDGDACLPLAFKAMQGSQQAFYQTAEVWVRRMRKCLGYANERSPWWPFIASWHDNIHRWLDDFHEGKYCFAPVQQYKVGADTVQSWSYLDRLIMHLIFKIIKPTFKHIVSPKCLHLSGPSIIKQATAQIKEAINSQRFQYAIRLDIRAYYASIQHPILLNQLRSQFDDPKIVTYLSDIVTVAIDKGGHVILPTKGIFRQSTLSPFFGALYLGPLDQAFANRKEIFFLRFMDDVIILVTNKRHYAKARKRLFGVLKTLQLQLSPHKTRMGKLKTGFHFLGVKFEVTRIPQSKIQVTTVRLHTRTCRRAHDKVQTLRQHAVNPAHIQRYLSRWATWWKSVIGVDKRDVVIEWINCVGQWEDAAAVAWFGTGLLLGSSTNTFNAVFNTISTIKRQKDVL